MWVKRVLDSGKPACGAKHESSGIGQAVWVDHIGSGDNVKGTDFVLR